MNRFLLGALLVFAAPVSAQDVPAPTLQTSPQTLLTPEFIRSVQYIGAGIFELKTQGEETLGTFKYVPDATAYDRLKGADDLRTRGLIFPPELRDKAGQKIIVFARFDGEAKRARIVGYLPSTDASVKRLNELIAKNPTLEFRLSSDKPGYSPGEPVTAKLEVKNVSGAPVSIYTGEFAVQFSFRSGEGSSSRSDSEARKRPPVTTLAPGESWKYEQTYDGPLSVGPLGLEFYYEGSDALKMKRALPSDFYLERGHGELSLQVAPATGAQKNTISARLKSPRWDEQLDAAQKTLLSDNSSDWKLLDPFATHPYEALRRIAAQAMIKSGQFSPALKTLLYSGTYIESYGVNKPLGDFGLALLARAAVEEEAYKRGFTLARVGSPLHSLRDPRVGDIVAARLKSNDPMQGGVNNGAILNVLCGIVGTMESADKPPTPELTAKILTVWKEKRMQVAKPFTQAQLDAEMALARKIGFDDFKVGPYYEEMVDYVEEGRKNNFGNAPQDVLDAELLGFPAKAAPDLIRVLEWRNVSSPPEAALRFIARSGDPKAFVFLAKIAYDESGPDGNARMEAVRLMGEMDYARAKVHLEGFFARPKGKWGWRTDAPRLGAALALAAHGEERAVPVIFSDDFKNRLNFLGNESRSSLEEVTEQKFSNWLQWTRWWEREGSKQEWK